MSKEVSKYLLSWMNLVKDTMDTNKESWTEIPNVGMFKNLGFHVGDVDLDNNDITIKLKYDNWSEPQSGKFMRDLAELIEPNFNLAMRLIDDPTHHYYSQYPQLRISWDNNLNNYESIITIEKGKSDAVWVIPSGHETITCKPDIQEVLYCLLDQIKKKQKDSGKEFDKLPCEQK